MSSSKRQQTAAKRQREQALKERRAFKLAKKEARRAKAADGDPTEPSLQETDDPPAAPPAQTD
jgi:hypothetical protein